MFSVTFEYDESIGKWDVLANGAVDATEAVHGFNAVVITASEARPGMHNTAELQPDGRYKINVGVEQLNWVNASSLRLPTTGVLDSSQEIMKIVHLPNGRWHIETEDGRHSESFDYTSVGYWINGAYLFVAYTCYYGEEKLIFAVNPTIQPHESVDRSLALESYDY